MVTSNSNEHTTLETAAGSPTRLFVLGATGGIGRAVVHQALDRGDRVTAFVRSPDKLGGPREGLAVVRGDPRNVEELRVALPNHDAVLSAIGPTGLGATTIVGDCAESYGVADGRMPSGARLTVSRADVAHFLLEEFERRAHVQRIVGLASLARSRDSASRPDDFAQLT